MSRSIHDLANVWPAVQQASDSFWALPDFEPVWISAASRPAEASDTDAALKAAQAGAGWLRYCSASYDGVEWRGHRNAAGQLLQAEWLGADDGSVRISYRLAPDPCRPGQGRLYTYREQAVVDAAVSAEKDLWRSVLSQAVLLKGIRSGRDLAYRVYWGVDDVDDAQSASPAVRRLFARFAGFTSKGPSS